MQSDVRIIDVTTTIIEAHARTPIKFGSVVVDDLPLAIARVTVENRAGKVAEGWGAIFLVDLWAWPVSRASHAKKSMVMRRLFEAWGQFLTGLQQSAHPIDLFMQTVDELSKISRRICVELTPGEELGHLGELICASPFDHAIHDAFGNVNGIDSYQGYGPDHMHADLSRYLGPAFQHIYPSHFLRRAYLPAIAIFHLVGGLDELWSNDHDITAHDLPGSLNHWIERDGVFCHKIKLRGNDLGWDIARICEVSAVYDEVRSSRRQDLPPHAVLTLDSNEQCDSPEYMIALLRHIQEQRPKIFDQILYLEQPTNRDLTVHPHDMRLLATYKPVLVDEGLASLDDFDRALELGWSGIALKSCKSLSLDLLMIAKAEQIGIPYAIQDLCNPSLALIQSVGLAARSRPIKGVEANSRQFFPNANESISSVHPEICTTRDGYVRTASIQGTGLGFQIEHIAALRELFPA